MNANSKLFGIRSLVLVVTVAVLLLGGAGITGAAARSAIPGDALYPMKTTLEQTRLSLASDAGDRAELKMGFAEQRLGEIEKLIAEGRYREVGAAVLGFEEAINGAILELETVAQADPTRAATLAREITVALTRYAQTLAGLLAAAPESVKQEVDRALESARLAGSLDLPAAGDDNGNENSNANSNDNEAGDDNGNDDDTGNTNGNDDNANGNGDDLGNTNGDDSNDNGVDDANGNGDDSGNDNGDDDVNGNGDDSGNDNGDDSGGGNTNDDDGSANNNGDDSGNTNDDDGSAYDNGDDSGNDNGDDSGGGNTNDDNGDDSGNDNGDDVSNGIGDDSGGGKDDNGNDAGNSNDNGDDSGKGSGNGTSLLGNLAALIAALI